MGCEGSAVRTQTDRYSRMQRNQLTLGDAFPGECDVTHRQASTSCGGGPEAQRERAVSRSHRQQVKHSHREQQEREWQRATEWEKWQTLLVL